MRILSVSGFVLAVLLCSPCPAAKEKSAAREKHDAQWIWYDAGDPARQAPAGKVWFRREVRAAEPSTGAARVVCDDRFTLWANGRKVGSGTAGKVYRFNLNGIVSRGPNVLAVEAENLGGKAGLYVDGEVRGQGGQGVSFDTGPEWVATRSKPQGDAWLQPDFDTAAWRAVKVIGPHEQSPWKEIVLKETYLDRFDVPEGFELRRVAEPKLVGSLVAMTWGNRGRLIVSRERGPILSVIDDNGDGIYDRVVEYTKEVENCQGLCTVGDDLYAVGNGPKGVGLYRLPDKNHDDKADEVQFLVKHQGGMGDHGPHDVVFGPDGWLYHNLGNHAHVTQKPEPTSAVRDYGEDYLLVPKFEDAGGHAVGIKAPGGTIWRFTPDAKHWWLETSGFRNEYDFAFNAAGDMFSFDSDMEWDVGAYWYRPVRVTHCTAGAEFGWRSGAAKWPAYYFDSLPAAVDVGRGSPTGVIFYDHTQFPQRFHGAFLCCDWSLGRLLAFHLKKSGASYIGTFETLLSGNPLNVTDVEVDRDGSVVFTTGGRATEGGIYRLRHTSADTRRADAANVAELLRLPQIESAWAREIAVRVKAAAGPKWETELAAAVRSDDAAAQIRALTLLNQLGPAPDLKLLLDVSLAKDATVRAFATHLLGFQGGNSRGGQDVPAALVRLLADPDPTVRRRACEAFVRSGIEGPVDGFLALTGGEDRWLRFAARLALERIPRDQWFQKALGSRNAHVVTEALLASYRLDRRGSAKTILEQTSKMLAVHPPMSTLELKLAALRLTELALLQGVRNSDTERIGQALLNQFPTKRTEVDAEIARILVVLNVDGAAAKIVPLVEKSRTNGEQLHYALTLRYLNAGWTFDLKRRVLDWYEGTLGWEGGNSLTGYVRNVVEAFSEKLSPQERKEYVQQWRKHPVAAALLVRISNPDQIADFDRVMSALLDESAVQTTARQEEVIQAAVRSLAKKTSASDRALLRRLYDEHPDHREGIARAIAENPVEADWPVMVRTLQFADATTIQLCLTALGDLSARPKEAEPYRTVIQTALKLGKSGGMGAVRILRVWTGADYKPTRHRGVRRPGRHAGLGEVELPVSLDQAVAFYQKWYRDKFPAAPPPELPKADLAKSKYTFQQIADLSEHDTRASAERGRLIFSKAKCVKCHRFRSEGEGVGPDLTSIRRRFQRKEIVESIIYPSQVISDQYRMVQVETKEGQVYVGMPIPGTSKKNKIVLLLSDATKLEIPKSRIEEQTASKVSVMPAGLLDPLSRQEVADLLAFLETSKFNAPLAAAAKK